MFLYMEILDRFYYDNRLERLNADGVSESPALINFYTLDAIYRTKYKGPSKDVFLIVFKYKHDEHSSYCMKFGSEFLRDSYFNRLRRKLINRKSPIKRK